MPQDPTGARWSGPGSSRRRISWRAVLWFLIFPQRSQRMGLTLSGLLVVVISVAIGVAAYNSASNILFLTLSLLLGCIILSGILSWQNFRGLSWRLEVSSPLRVGAPHGVALRVRNSKWFLPSYGIWFEVRLARTGVVKDLILRQRLDAKGELSLECQLTPSHRGAEKVEVFYVGSYYPFGFLRKGIPVDVAEEVIVWPAPIEYRRFPASAWQRTPSGEQVARIGQGGDLLSLRRYQMDDSHRQIHWKASARLRQLMVRQHATETGHGFSLWVDLSSDLWSKPDQFELLCSFAATLAEDLFTSGKLRAAAVGERSLLPIRGARDLEAFLDRLAMATPAARSPQPLGSRLGGSFAQSTRNLITFSPDGARGVVAFVNGERAAST